MDVVVEITENLRTQNRIRTWRAMILHSPVHSDCSLRLFSSLMQKYMQKIHTSHRSET